MQAESRPICKSPLPLASRAGSCCNSPMPHSAPEAPDLSAKWRQHLTLELPDPRPGCIWVHACSVGEVGSVAPLIRRLVAMGHDVHLSVVTATGHAHARRLLGDRVSLSFLPWDLPGAFRRFVDRLQPRLLLLVETEFWPGMLGACGRRGIPVIGINTRISDRSYPRYRATRLFWRRVLRPVVRFLCQSELDAERLASLGVPRERIRVSGNLKLAVRAPQADAEAIRRRLDPGGTRPILLLASTHEPEERLLLKHLDAWRRIRPDLLPVFVPRHPERFDAVDELLREHGLHVLRWSAGEAHAADAVLVDAMGVLPKLYLVADLVVIGGSLADIGGHNPLEAAVCGRGVVTGPHVQNFRAIMKELAQAGGAIVAASAEETGAAIARLLEHPDELKALHAAAFAFMQRRGDVLERVLDELGPWLAAPEGGGS